jgi:Transposase, Mutator family
MTGIGPVAVRCRRMRDRVREGSERIRFSSAILPPYAPRSKSLEVLIPILYLKGISTGEFEEALAVLLGKDAGGQSASTVARLKDAWSEERVRWSKRDLWSSSAPRPRSRTYLAQRTSSKTHSQRSAALQGGPNKTALAMRSTNSPRPPRKLAAPRRSQSAAESYPWSEVR